MKSSKSYKKSNRSTARALFSGAFRCPLERCESKCVTKIEIVMLYRLKGVGRVHEGGGGWEALAGGAV